MKKLVSKRFLFILALVLVAFLNVSYAALNTQLVINGEAHVRPDADIRIVKVKLVEPTINAYEKYKYEFSKRTLNLNPVLSGSDSRIEYEVTVRNSTNVIYLFGNTVTINNSNSNLKYEIVGATASSQIAPRSDFVFKIVITNKTNSPQEGNIQTEHNFRTRNKYTVSFNTDGGSSIASIIVDEGDSVSKPTDPTKRYYKLDKWTLNDVEYDFSKPIESSITLKAVWTPLTKAITSINGEALMTKMKELANNTSISNGYSYIDNNVKAFKRATDAQYEAIKSSLTSTNNITGTTSDYDIWMWYDSASKTIYYYTEADLIRITGNTVRMFAKFDSLEDISGASDFYTADITDMNRMFQNSKKISDLTPIANWDVSNVTDMTFMFGHSVTSDTMSITDLTPLKNWDVSNVTTFYQTFKGNKNLSSLAGLELWDVSSSTNFEQIFNYCDIRDITPILDWNFNSGNINFSYMFNHNPNLDSGDLKEFTNKPGYWGTSGTYNAY